MATKHLNVQLAPNDPIRLNVTGLTELTDVITVIANYYKDSISSPEKIQLKYQDGTLVKDLDDVPAEYYMKLKEAAAVTLEIYLKPSPTPSRESSIAQLEETPQSN
jgi:hypothetical protein